MNSINPQGIDYYKKVVLKWCSHADRWASFIHSPAGATVARHRVPSTSTAIRFFPFRSLIEVVFLSAAGLLMVTIHIGANRRETFH